MNTIEKMVAAIQLASPERVRCDYCEGLVENERAVKRDGCSYHPQCSRECERGV